MYTPFQVEMVVDEEEDVETKTEELPTMDSVKKWFAGWDTVIPTQQTLEKAKKKLFKGNGPNGEAYLRVPWESYGESSDHLTYTFKKVGPGWRLVKIYIDQVGL